jgi:hypothetical protein
MVTLSHSGDDADANTLIQEVERLAPDLVEVFRQLLDQKSVPLNDFHGRVAPVFRHLSEVFPQHEFVVTGTGETAYDVWRISYSAKLRGRVDFRKFFAVMQGEEGFWWQGKGVQEAELSPIRDPVFLQVLQERDDKDVITVFQLKDGSWWHSKGVPVRAAAPITDRAFLKVLQESDSQESAATADAAGATAIPPDDRDEDQTEEGAREGVPNFDQDFKKPVVIPLFIWDDGKIRPFEGFCRGTGPISGYEEEWEESIGVFTAEGKYFSVGIDTRVHCAVPQFYIDEKPFRFPIVSFGTMAQWVDPETGILKPPPHLQQKAGVQRSSSVAQDAAESGTPVDNPTSSEEQQ